MACEHIFVETKRKYIEPALTVQNVLEGIRFQGSPEATARAMYGFTVIELTCTICGDLKMVEHEGNLT